ncbi:MAG: hypothetical protein C0619_04855 [Desulfuromonas sp.]|nr:MAG: hypothetical protein C0619_04855 [Desulfuromonas sp.]
MVKIALFMFVFIVFAFCFLYFWGINPGDITVYVTADQGITFPAPIILITAVLIGLLLGNGVHVLSIGAFSLGQWRRNRRQKKDEEIGAIYRDGVARLLSGDLKKARQLLQKALDRDSRRTDTYLALASVALQEGSMGQAIDLLLKARDLDPKSVEVLFKLAATYAEAGRVTDAIEVYRELLASDSENRKALRALRDLHVEQGEWQDALSLQKRILKAASAGPKADSEKQQLLQLRYEVAFQALESGEIEDASTTFRELIKQDATFTPARVSLGDAYRRLKRSSDAAEVYQEGYRVLKKSVFLSRLEDLYMSAEDPSALLGFYRAQMQKDNDDLLLKLYLGRLCLRLEMVDEALEQLHAVESTGVEFRQLHLLLGEANRRRNKIDEALAEYQQALGIDNHLNLGFVCSSCAAAHGSWLSRCPSCGAWDSLVLPERQQIQDARPLEQKAIPHGQR